MIHEFGSSLTLQSVLGWGTVLTHRQFETLNQWLRDQWNEPDRTDVYLMQLSCDVRRGPVKGSHTLDRAKIPFKFERKKKAKPLPIHKDEQGNPISVARAMAGRVGGRLGYTLRRVDKQGNLLSEERIAGAVPTEERSERIKRQQTIKGKRRGSK